MILLACIAHEDEFIIFAFRALLQRLAWEIHPHKTEEFYLNVFHLQMPRSIVYLFS